MEIMSVPVDGLVYYLGRDSWLKEFSLENEETVELNKLVIVFLHMMMASFQ